jgi:exodeoxyribonuclease VII small subunit
MPPLRKIDVQEIEMAAKSNKIQSFEAALAELEQVVADMESGKLALEDSLVSYKRGAELLSFCRSRLDAAQQQVRVLEEGSLKDFTASGDSNADR